MAQQISEEILRTSAEKFGVVSWGSPEELRYRLERTLAVQHMGAAIRECECGFSAPIHESVDSCPGCGVTYEVPTTRDKEDTSMQTVQAAAPKAAAKKTRTIKKSGSKVASISSRVKAKQDEEQAQASAAERKAELDAKKKLAALEKKVDQLRSDAGRIEWDIGQHLTEIHANNLWQATGEFKSFAEYVKARFEFTKQTATAFMKIAQGFKREDASKIDLGHLRLIVSIPEENKDVREELTKRVLEAPEKPTYRELAAEVKAKRAELGLVTERAGFEGTVLISGRFKPGVIAEGEWRPGPEGGKVQYRGQFEIGDSTLVIEDLGEEGGFLVKLKKPRG